MSDIEVVVGRCYTDNKIERVTFIWKISDFSGRTDNVSSSYLPSAGVENVKNWWLLLCPSTKNKPNVSIYLKSEIPTETVGTVKMSLINDKGNVAISKISNCKSLDSSTYFENFVTRDYIDNKENGVLPNDELTIVCEIDIRSSETRYQEFVPAKFEPPLCRLTEDMGNLLSSESLSDLTITVGEREFRAHKAILAARSPVFAAMFRNEMVENKFSSVDITDIDPDVFQVMLEYIYTGKVILSTNKSKELLAVANKYELERLKFMCEEALYKELSVDNVLENIILADYYNASNLKEHSLYFIMKNSSNVIGSSRWDNFKLSHQSLMIEILERICSLI